LNGAHLIGEVIYMASKRLLFNRRGSALRGLLISTGERTISDDRHQSEGPRIVPNPLSYGVSPIAQEADKEKDKGAVCHVVMVH
jgi:hypothetical protein